MTATDPDSAMPSLTNFELRREGLIAVDTDGLPWAARFGEMVWRRLLDWPPYRPKLFYFSLDRQHGTMALMFVWKRPHREKS